MEKEKEIPGKSGSEKAQPPDKSNPGHGTGNENSQRPRPVRRVMADTQSKSILNITNLVTLGILIGLILFIIKIASVLGIFLFSFVIAFLLYPAVEWLNNRHIPRVWAIFIVFVVLGSLLLGIVAAVIPAIIAQANSLVEQLPEFSVKWEEDWAPMLTTIKDFLYEQGVRPEDIQSYVNSIIPTVQQWGTRIGQTLFSGVQGAVGVIIFLITVPIIVFYLLLDAQRIYTSLIAFAPKRTSTEIQHLLNRLAEMLNHYLRGQFKLSFLMFAVTTIALLILGVKHALLLGVLAGLTEVIPIIGPLIALIPAIFVSYFTESDAGFLAFVETGWIRALIVFAFYMALQYTENNFFVPRIMGKDLNLHPLTVMFSILAGGYLAGVVGMLLSLPMAASLKVVFETYYPSFIERVGDLMSRNPVVGSPGEE